LLRAGRSGDRIKLEARFSAPVHTSPGVHTSLLYNGYRIFPGIKRLGRGVEHPPASSAEVKERVELYLYSPSGRFLACSRVNFTFTFYALHYLTLQLNYENTFRDCMESRTIERSRPIRKVQQIYCNGTYGLGAMLTLWPRSWTFTV